MNIIMKCLNLSIVVLVGFGSLVPSTASDPVELKRVKEFRGSNPDATLKQVSPKSFIITNWSSLHKVWKDWGIQEDLPTLDPTKEFAVVAAGSTSSIWALPTLDEKGNLRVRWAMKPTARDFSYHIIIFRVEGVKTFQGEPLRRP